LGEPAGVARISTGYCPGATAGDAAIVSVAVAPVTGAGCAVTVRPEGRPLAAISTGASSAVRVIKRLAVVVAPGRTLIAPGLNDIFSEDFGVTVSVMLALASVVAACARTFKTNVPTGAVAVALSVS